MRSSPTKCSYRFVFERLECNVIFELTHLTMKTMIIVIVFIKQINKVSTSIDRKSLKIVVSNAD